MAESAGQGSRVTLSSHRPSSPQPAKTDRNRSVDWEVWKRPLLFPHLLQSPERQRQLPLFPFMFGFTWDTYGQLQGTLFLARGRSDLTVTQESTTMDVETVWRGQKGPRGAGMKVRVPGGTAVHGLGEATW